MNPPQLRAAIAVPPPRIPPLKDAGVTVVELLVVVAIMVALSALAIPAFNAIRGGTDFATALYDISGTFNQARGFAVANNTYVLVGIAEMSAAQDESANPQTSGTGRLAIAVIASKSGNRPYQALFPSNLIVWGFSQYGNGGAFGAVTKLLTLQNVHLVDLQYNGTSPASLPATGGMMRPALGSNGSYYDISNANGTSNTQFAWPLGSKIRNPTPQYLFSNVIEFDPQGSARIFSTNNPAKSSFPDTIPQYIEIGLQPSHGTLVPGAPASQLSGQIAAIQISGLSGAVHVYRP